MFSNSCTIELPLGSISEEICNSKVSQLPLDCVIALGLAEDVVRLEVPVEDVGAPGVQVVQSVGKDPLTCVKHRNQFNSAGQ